MTGQDGQQIAEPVEQQRDWPLGQLAVIVVQHEDNPPMTVNAWFDGHSLWHFIGREGFVRPDGCDKSWVTAVRPLRLVPAGAPDQSLRAAPHDGLAGSDEAVRLPTDDEICAANAVADEHGVSRDVMHIALAKVHRLIAARVRAEAVAEERQRVAQVISAAAVPGDPDGLFANEEGWNRALECILRDLHAAAGSVPVATPEPCDHGHPEGHWVTSSWCPAPGDELVSWAELAEVARVAKSYFGFAEELWERAKIVAKPSVGTGTPAEAGQDGWIGRALMRDAANRSGQPSGPCLSTTSVVHGVDEPTVLHCGQRAGHAGMHRFHVEWVADSGTPTEAVSGGSGHAERPNWREHRRAILDRWFERNTGRQGSGLAEYVQRLRASHGAIVTATGTYSGCRCGETVCGKDLLLAWVDELRASYEAKVTEFAAETLRATDLTAEVAHYRAAIEGGLGLTGAATRRFMAGEMLEMALQMVADLLAAALGDGE